MEFEFTNKQVAAVWTGIVLLALLMFGSLAYQSYQNGETARYCAAHGLGTERTGDTLVCIRR